ncbi:MAG: bifunctional homocysteine S-methyltransferase/methylenetetrahydrofolate reductase [Anaerolineales bacterium]|nr:bifunctional homocysteine S-methyltransferase/methylenetetrahydrofolate reductase [Anaerolineales bacterium]
MNSIGSLLDVIKNQPPLLADGAMGTMLHTHGVNFDACFDALNIEQPDIVAEIHREYIKAGAEIITMNSFGANRFKLAEHGMEGKLREINLAGARLAREAANISDKQIYIAGSIGPLGVRMAPFGRVQPGEAREAYEEQISVLCEGGIDLLIIETMTDLYEITEAVSAAREVCGLPVLASMTFTRDDRTLLGDTPNKVALKLYEIGADVIGVNCSGGPAQLLRIMGKMREAVPGGVFSVMPNAGWPEQTGGRIQYPAGPEYFGEYALAFRQAGASIIGGCCGTTPEHIHAMRVALDETPSVGITQSYIQITAQKSEFITAPDRTSALEKTFGTDALAIAVEMSPPKGLNTNKILAGASMLADVGANVINVTDSPRARMRMSPWAVCNLIQEKAGIETTLHFPTRGRNLLRVQGDLLAAHALGVRNVFVVMGDPTSIGDYPDAMDNYDLVPSGLVKLIKQGLNAGIDHSGAELGAKTHFYVGAALNLAPKDIEREIKVLRTKLSNGADFFLTQPIYHPEEAEAFLSAYKKQYGVLEKPIITGILPLYGVRHARFLHHEVPGIVISDEVMKRMEDAGDSAPKEGVKIALELIESIRPWSKGIYLMPPFGRYDIAAEIIDTLR